MSHYICTGGCEGVSQEQGTCQSGGCYKQDQLLEECTCADAKHQAAGNDALSEDQD